MEAAWQRYGLPDWQAEFVTQVTQTCPTIVASRTPLPAEAAALLGAVGLASNYGIAAVAPFGHTVLDLVGNLRGPTARIAHLARTTIWLPTLLRHF